jgi:hypothetical protein
MKRILALALILLATVTTMASAVEITPVDPGTCEITIYPYPTEIGIPLPLDRHKVRLSGVIHIGDPATTRIITDLAIQVWQRAGGNITTMNVCCQAIDGTVCHALRATEDVLK